MRQILTASRTISMTTMRTMRYAYIFAILNNIENSVIKSINKGQMSLKFNIYYIMDSKIDKLNYLQKENEELRREINDFKELLKMNKTEIDILSSQFDSPQDKKIIDILHRYREQHKKMEDKLAAAHQQIKQLITENFMLKQMNDEQLHQIKALDILHGSSIKALQEHSQELQNKIIHLEKFNKEYDKVSGFVLKTRNIVTPNQISIQLKEKQHSINQQLQLMTLELELAKKKEENLMIVNTVLRNKIVSLQAKLAMPNRNIGEVLDRSLKRLMLYFIEVQKKIITGDEDSQSDEEEDIQLIAPELSSIFPEKQLRIQKDYGVPHLDLLKIREQMTHGVPKIKEALAARNHLTDKQKIERLEIELEYTRRQMSRNIIDLKHEKEKRKKAERMADELEARAELLVNSNKHLKEKVEKYWGKLQKMISNKDNGNFEMEEFNTDLESTLIPPSTFYKASKKHLGDRKESEQIMNQPMDYKIYLEMLAMQLNENKKLESLEKMKRKEEGPKMKRSTSNPFLYFNQRRQDIMMIKNQEQKKKDERYRLEQTVMGGGHNFEQDLDGYDI